MNTIKTMVVFDAATIWNKYRDQAGRSASTAFQIHHEDVFMVTSPEYLKDPKTQATPDLHIQAEIGDQIRWIGVTLSEDIQYSVVIYSITHKSMVTTTPVPVLANPSVPIPVKQSNGTINPLEFNAQKIPEYYLACDAISPGTESYALNFYIAEGRGGGVQICGYFMWDPTITISRLG